MRTDFCLLDHLAAMRVSYKTVKNNNNDFLTKHNNYYNNYYYYAGLKTHFRTSKHFACSIIFLY